MEEAETFAGLMNHHTVASPTLTAGARDWGAYLLSPERAQRFELLMHLIANLGQPLVVCGPEGIGKTTFLWLLRERAFDSWRVVSMLADSRLSHSDIIARIAEQLALVGNAESAVADYLQQQARNKNMLVLLLDDAAKLAPGVMNALWQFARTNPALRLVFALCPDEAHLKTASDGAALGDCRFIDIPALTEPLCMAYIRRLSSARSPRLQLPEEAAALQASAVYHASHGVPGRINQLLSEAPPVQAKDKARTPLLVAFGVAAIVVAALIYPWQQVSTPTPALPLPAPINAQQQAAPPAPSQPLALDAKLAASPPLPLDGVTTQQAAAPAYTEKTPATKPEPALPPTQPAANAALPGMQVAPPTQAEDGKTAETPVQAQAATPPMANPNKTETPAAPAIATAAATMPVALPAPAANVAPDDKAVPADSKPLQNIAADAGVAPAKTALQAAESKTVTVETLVPTRAALPLSTPEKAETPAAPAITTAAAATPPTPPAPAAKVVPGDKAAPASSKPSLGTVANASIAPAKTALAAAPAVAPSSAPAVPAPAAAPVSAKPQWSKAVGTAPAAAAAGASKAAEPASVAAGKEPAKGRVVPSPVALKPEAPPAKPPIPEAPLSAAAIQAMQPHSPSATLPLSQAAHAPPPVTGRAAEPSAPPAPSVPVSGNSAPDATEDPASDDDDAPIKEVASYSNKLWAFREEAPPASPPAEANLSATPSPNGPPPNNLAQPAPTSAVASVTPMQPTAKPAPFVALSRANAAPASAANTSTANRGGGVAGLLGADWLLAQSPQAYTLRIMSARAPASIQSLLERYPMLRGRTASFKSRNGALELYPVYYGVFASLPEAAQAATALPAYLGKPLPRQLNLVQQEVRSAQRASAP